MPILFSEVQAFENQRVYMRFDDDCEAIAFLLSVTEDTGGSMHLIYNNVEWASDPRDLFDAQDATVYAEGESLISIEEAPLPPA